MSIDHLAVAESYSGYFTEAVTGNLAAAVPSCPGWTVDDLVAHLAEVQSWWTLVLVAKGAQPTGEDARRAADTGPDRVEGWREISARYLAVQREYPADTPAWVWWNDAERATAADVASRQAHEAVVHCWDAWNAVGRVEPIPAEVAADGVGEFLDRFLHGPAWESGPVVVELVATDTGESWLVGAGGSAGSGDAVAAGKPRRLDAGEPTARVAGPAEQLYLLLWRRVGLEGVTVTGDRAGVEALLSWPRLG
ncbi:maleylpyruvate isomerase family mycothiol-dependent enzyme [Saccharothrix syringae]|uniref:Maleylpyruvate isomerase family mycothiol-dependent enzyme n=1 Tax=Saccharothrix syringae TaxID=103733 RepID=A0A5Q0GSJ4_SACSY|nr:maleylpyruvate isomerase family mycothiol-dependent enzyme [Saccharothrix syringae]QFZ16480.1 maleylpyruvate isomerase family mycothiol-dependent enzyme [Saccharothrix syringae]